MKKIISLLPIIFSFSLSVFSQVIPYEKFYGDQSGLDAFNDIQTIPDGGYIAVGVSQEMGLGQQFYVVKFDTNGNEEILGKYGGNGQEIATTVVVLDDRYLIGGHSQPFGELTRESYLISIDLAGNLISEVTFGGDGEDLIYAMSKLANGKIVVASTTEDIDETGANINLRLYEADLTLTKEVLFATENKDIPTFISEIEPDGNILVSGESGEEGIILNYSNDLETLNWEVIGNMGFGSFKSFTTGARYDDNSFAFLTPATEEVSSHLVIIDILTGEFLEAFPHDFINSSPIDMNRIGNDLFFVSNNNALHQFNVIDNEFSSVTSFGRRLNTLAVTNEKIAVAGSSFSSAVFVAQFDNVTMNEDWEILMGDLTLNYSLKGIKLSEGVDGDMFIIGDSVNSLEHIFIKKIDKHGLIIWETTVDGTDEDLNPYDILPTSDGGCVIAYNDFGFAAYKKYSAEGLLSWNSFPSIQSNSTLAKEGKLVTGIDGGFYFCITTTYSIPFSQIVYTNVKIIKFDNLGNELWVKNHDLAGHDTAVRDIVKLANGDLMLLCNYLPEDAPFINSGLIKIDSEGEFIWSQLYEANATSEELTSIVEASDNTLFLAGNNGYNRGSVYLVGSDGAIIDGGIVWSNPSGTTIKSLVINEEDIIYTLNEKAVVFPENVINTPIRSNVLSIDRYNEDLEASNGLTFGQGLQPIAKSMIHHSEGGRVALGQIINQNVIQTYLIYVDEDGINGSIEVQPQGELKLFPTVSDGSFSIDFKSQHIGDVAVGIYTTNGQLIQEFTDEKSIDKWNKTLNLKKLPAGSYFLNLRLDKFSWTQKFIIQ